jgi:hypothetical protein
VLGSISSYLAVVLVVAKITYGRIYREEMGNKKITDDTYDFQVDIWKNEARSEATGMAAIMGTPWPVSVPLWLVLKIGFWVCRRFVTSQVREPENVRVWEQAHRIKTLEAEVTKLKRAAGDDTEITTTDFMGFSLNDPPARLWKKHYR